MARRGSGLAERLRAKLDARASEEAARIAERERVEEAEREARSELLDDLEAFGRAVGHLEVERVEAVLTLRYGDAHVVFRDAEDELHLEIHQGPASNATHVLFREAALDDRWIWSSRRGAHEERRPLFDEGLELLMSQALGLPTVTEATNTESPEMSLRLAEALLDPESVSTESATDEGADIADRKRTL